MSHHKKKTKIVATLGPASSDKETLKTMIENGVNICRINFSHGSHEDHLKVIKIIRELNTELKTHTAILADLQGPKIRIGVVEEGVVLENGHELVMTTEEAVSTADRVFINYEAFPRDVTVGEAILIDDGKLHLEVTEIVSATEVRCKVNHGGPLSSKKGVNLPNTKVSIPSLTEKDLVDLHFALENQISWIGLSFVRSRQDLIELKKIIRDKGKSKFTQVIAKIEKPEAVADIDGIVEESDALMVARGDLGVEIPMQNVPLIQKEIVYKAQRAAKPVIIATQMMETMITNITPTRAEVNDVANAVLDGADAVMLSGETSVGKHPVEVIKAMYKIVTRMETFEGIYNKDHKIKSSEERLITDSVCQNAVSLAETVGAKAIITMTFSGYTAFKISSHRPKAGIFVFTSNYRILNMLSLVWGVQGFYYDKFVSTDHTIDDIKFILRKEGFVEDEDLVINIASMPIANKGMSNMIKVSQAHE
ncbi:MAG: pyruvate kinase [Salibacteraceae bacterium]